jgi:hypothetical protein
MGVLPLASQRWWQGRIYQSGDLWRRPDLTPSATSLPMAGGRGR